MAKRIKMTEDFRIALNQFVNDVQAMLDNHLQKNNFNWKVTITTSEGGRYIKLIKTDENQRSVFCFVDKSNGDILKPASWRAPAKHSRGSIFSVDPMYAVTPYGAKYL